MTNYQISTVISILQNENKYLQEERLEYEKTMIKIRKIRELNIRTDVGCSQADERMGMQQ